MKKSNFVALILGTVGCVFFALGMCMCLIQEWGVSRQGIVCGAAGLVVLLADLLIWRKMEGKAPIVVSPRTLGLVALGVAGALLLGVGMCLSMVFGKLVAGIVVGLIGIVALLLIPLAKGLKDCAPALQRGGPKARSASPAQNNDPTKCMKRRKNHVCTDETSRQPHRPA